MTCLKKIAIALTAPLLIQNSFAWDRVDLTHAMSDLEMRKSTAATILRNTAQYRISDNTPTNTQRFLAESQQRYLRDLYQVDVQRWMAESARAQKDSTVAEILVFDAESTFSKDINCLKGYNKRGWIIDDEARCWLRVHARTVRILEAIDELLAADISPNKLEDLRPMLGLYRSYSRRSIEAYIAVKGDYNVYRSSTSTDTK